MSQEDVEVIREAFDRWNRGDIRYWIEHARPGVEIWSKYALLDRGTEPYRGHEGMHQWRAEIDRNYGLHEVSADEIQEVGAKLPVLGSVRSRGKASGTELRHPFGWVCELRDGALFRSTSTQATPSPPRGRARQIALRRRASREAAALPRLATRSERVSRVRRAANGR